MLKEELTTDGGMEWRLGRCALEPSDRERALHELRSLRSVKMNWALARVCFCHRARSSRSTKARGRFCDGRAIFGASRTKRSFADRGVSKCNLGTRRTGYRENQ